MAGDGSAALGAPEIAGAMVNPRGFTKKMSVGAVGGVVGAVAASAVVICQPLPGSLPRAGETPYAAISAFIGLRFSSSNFRCSLII